MHYCASDCTVLQTVKNEECSDRNHRQIYRRATTIRIFALYRQPLLRSKATSCGCSTWYADETTDVWGVCGHYNTNPNRIKIELRCRLAYPITILGSCESHHKGYEAPGKQVQVGHTSQHGRSEVEKSRRTLEKDENFLARGTSRPLDTTVQY